MFINLPYSKKYICFHLIPGNHDLICLESDDNSSNSYYQWKNPKKFLKFSKKISKFS